MTSKHKEKTLLELKKFGLVMTAAFGVLGTLLLWKGRPLGPYFVGLAALFLLLALIAPGALRTVEKYWMILGEKMGTVMTFVLMTIVFVVAVTPMGLLMRLFGKDPMGRKFDEDRKSYWEPMPTDGSSSRPYAPY